MNEAQAERLIIVLENIEQILRETLYTTDKNGLSTVLDFIARHCRI